MFFGDGNETHYTTNIQLPKANAARSMGLHSMYDSVINKAVKVHNTSLQTRQRHDNDLMKASMTSSNSNMREVDSLPHLVPQKTNVLTGASTSYYVDKSDVWNTEYLKLVNYQKKKEEAVYTKEAQRLDEKLPNLDLKN